MSRLRRFVPRVLLFIPAFLLPPILSGQTIDPSLYADLRWRSIGPFRAGWVTCIEGIPDQPDTFYFGAVGGGVWKTDDAGRSWNSLFDHESAAAIGALAIAPSDPRVIYVGTGHPEPRYDVISGDGVFRSGDGGRTWTKRGLENTRYIGRILVDPRDPNVVIVAALGHIFGPNRERGIFRSTDGGATWTQSLFVDENTGAVDLAADPARPDVIYAAAWQIRNYPWLSYFKPNVGPGSAVYKSTDAGRSWKRLSGGGWPASVIGRIGLAVSPGGRVWALVDAQAALASFDPARTTPSAAGLYRSEDGGATWTQVNATTGLSTYYFGRITPDAGNPDVLYVMGQSIRRTQDGGKTFTIIKGAPGGDDYHHFWVNPKHPDHMATGADQGAIVTVNGGKTWSDWYNQPTGQFYHVETDDRFPYWVYSGQQDMGTIATASRGDAGGLTFREWHPVGADERGWNVPDPSDPEIVYGTGLGGNVIRFDGRTGQGTNISPVVEGTYARRPTEVKHRYTWITPIAVSKKKPYAIYHASQVLFRSVDRGQSWTVISPDLTGAVAGTSGCDGEITLANARPCGFGVIYTIALSPHDENEIWVGTDSGLIQRTTDGGKTWRDVTPKGLPAWSKVATLDVSAIEPGVVYAAVDSHRLDDFGPHLYRTRDSGRTWTAITTGLPATHYTTVVRADPTRKGLLYAGTLGGAFVSFDDGSQWQPLQMNLPTVWVEDLHVHGDDLVAATNGRSLWILDGIALLRQLTPAVAGEPVHLFAPARAVRVRRNINHDTPLPPETPMGKNPPTGALIDYTLARALDSLTIEILDAKGSVVRKVSSADEPEKLTARRYFADAWVQPPARPSAAAGHHRFVWDLRGPRPKAETYDYSIAAIWGEDTPIEPEGPLVVPGTYTVRLTAGGKTLTKPLTVEADPRISASREDLVRQYDLAVRTAAEMDRVAAALQEVRARRKSATTANAKDLEANEKALVRMSARLSGLFSAIESGDSAPTRQAVAEFEEISTTLKKATGSTGALELRADPGDYDPTND
jgi:photosystem II stability/assembly factor-like uncharacterized protein